MNVKTKRIVFIKTTKHGDHQSIAVALAEKIGYEIVKFPTCCQKDNTIAIITEEQYDQADKSRMFSIALDERGIPPSSVDLKIVKRYAKDLSVIVDEIISKTGVRRTLSRKSFNSRMKHPARTEEQ